MKKKLLAMILALVVVFSITAPAMANYTPYTQSYYGTNYHNSNYNTGYYGRYYMSAWAEDMRIAYEPTWYESPQRQVARGEAFLLFLRAIQRSLDRQGYSRLTYGYMAVPFTDYKSVTPEAQQEVNVLYSNGILIGYEDNTMRFSQLLKRCEMAAIYSRFNRIYFNMGNGYGQWNYNGYNSYYNNNYNGYYNNYMYTDIQGHWAAQDIITASANGVLNGMGNGYFDTEGPLTIEQIWKILDCCVGYQGLKRSDIAYAMGQTFKVKFGQTIDESYGTATGTKVTNITTATSTITLNQGETRNIQVNIYPTNAAYQKLSWTSSNTNYVSIEESWNTSSGIAYVTVYGRAPTSSYITLTGYAMDGSGRSVRINVKVNQTSYGNNTTPTYITSAVPNPSYLNLNVGQTASATVTTYPAFATYNSITWRSDNTNVATVQVLSNTSIVVTAIGAGTTTIRGYAAGTGAEVCAIPVTVMQNNYPGGGTITDTTAPLVQLTGANSVNIDDMVVLTVTAHEDNLSSFVITEADIVGLTDGLSINKIQKVSNNTYEITLMGVKVSAIQLCIASGVAVDAAGNRSAESNGVVIRIHSGEN